MRTLLTGVEIAQARRWLLREIGSAEIALSVTPGLDETERGLKAATILLDLLDRIEQENLQKLIDGAENY